MTKFKAVGQKQQILENEVAHLRQQLSEKEREHGKQLDYFKGVIQDKDALNAKQKNEWAEIYGNMK